IQWLYFHGLGGSATMEYSTLVYTKYHFLINLYHTHIPISTISLAHMYTNSVLTAKKEVSTN
ncbi:hypothetical protein, partial [Holdemanella biformis]|uniref:hypothetical protein n=1 Tax=Holdemanella biformis TaxID=1735 RepID=UPI00265DB46F